MRVVPFTNQYQLAAELYGVSPTELRRRDESQAQELKRWLAIGDHHAIGAVMTWLRPDDRLFLTFTCKDSAAYGPLTEAAANFVGRAVHTVADLEQREAVDALVGAGFAVEFIGERFRLRFDWVLPMLKRAWITAGIGVHTADNVDEDRLFYLDNALRRVTPGTDGWRGDRRWFHDELNESPPFDPAAYLVAVDNRTGDYAGLVRIWRNADGPRFGLIGVLPAYRNRSAAAGLLKQAITAAATWGHDTFTAETSPSNRVIYPRMKRVGAESLGQFLQLRRG